MTAGITYLPERAGCRHDVAETCPEHGCPYCRLEVELDHFRADACDTCAQHRHAARQAFLALNPRVACELADCTHCAGCDVCGRIEPVCRTCGYCAGCESSDPADLCLVAPEGDPLERPDEAPPPRAYDHRFPTLGPEGDPC